MDESFKTLLMVDALRRRDPRLFVNGGFSDFDAGKGYAGGGRVGVSFPVGEEGNLNVGALGSAVKGKNYEKAQIEGADVSYNTGPHTVALNWNRKRPYAPMMNIEDPLNSQMSAPNWMVTYKREF